ncbi:MAG: DoxX family membrane protein, partial [Chloroflexaceae bacterium]|nr:DoxX family membrane protein [Chloroflexaceae bacterium]
MQKWLFFAVRTLFSLMFIISGLTKLVAPDRIGISGPPPGRAFIDSLKETGFVYQLLGATELVAGLALLVGIFAPLALVVLAPIIVNIAGYYLFLFPERLWVGGLVALAYLYLVWGYWASFKPLL